MHAAEDVRKDKPKGDIGAIISRPGANLCLNDLFAALEPEPGLGKNFTHAIGSPVSGPCTRDKGLTRQVALQVMRDLGGQLDLCKYGSDPGMGQVST